MSKLDCHVYGIPETTGGHRHAHAHILLPLVDAMTLRLDGVEHTITSGHLGFVAPEQFHHCVSAEIIVMINIPAPMIKEEDLELLKSQVCLPLTGDLVPLIQLIKSEVARNPHSDSLRYLYYYLYDKLVEQGCSKSLRYIREHFGEEISIAHLARLENYNVSYFTGWFKKQTGMSPSHYIRQVRVDKAKEILASTRYRLMDVAAQVGYTSNASFTRAFKEVEGISPVEYRRRSGGGAD